MADPFTASAHIPCAAPAELLALLCDRLEPEATRHRSPGTARLENWCGKVDLAVEAAGCLSLRARSDREDRLAVLKMQLAEHIHAATAGTVAAFAWEGHGAGNPCLPYFREMRVARTRQLTPLMRRVVLEGDAAHFATGGLHVRVLIPPTGRDPVWPHAAPDGRTIWPTGADALTPRVYTVREVDLARCEIALDVMQHPGIATPGADWSRQARAGDRVGLLGPGGAGLPPARWYLLAGDETALPAIARMVAALPANAEAVIRLEVADAREQQPLPSLARLDVQWLHRDGAAPGTGDQLERAVRALAFPRDVENVHVWAGCEQKTARALRRLITGERGLAKRRCAIAAYWRLGHPGIDLAD
ncbi:siderophore-interacting protein [Ancylobacter vacuolatus]|uniref:NADPH-dependent ferric siderophore reductase n=1 Tax=Ancylobacter vacuolatus TaxID=223389 RepID=A0ABU0DL17_9HYPH|nr:siderophore-interacting protein [Ancylobacter vacuolatus]MDQ0349131.1 NADPH-dependent ferric siderophore reductase [Ancylobacter vacuolatus]